MIVLIDRLKVEWHSSQFFRLGLLGVVLLLAGYGWLVMDDINRQLERELVGSRQQKQRLIAMQNENFWSDRAQQARNLRVQLESQFWQADTKGLAQANLQSRLDRLLRQKAVINMKMQIEDPVDVEGLEGLWQIDVLIEGAIAPSGMLDLLNEIETNPQVIFVNSLDFERQRFRMRLRTFVQSIRAGS
jgi:hypothetical protein